MQLAPIKDVVTVVKSRHNAGDILSCVGASTRPGTIVDVGQNDDADVGGDDAGDGAGAEAANSEWVYVNNLY